MLEIVVIGACTVLFVLYFYFRRKENLMSTGLSQKQWNVLRNYVRRTDFDTVKTMLTEILDALERGEPPLCDLLEEWLETLDYMNYKGELKGGQRT